MTDDELVRLAQAGDAGAFEQLVVRHQAAVFRAALAALRVPEEAEEAAQDALLRAWQKLGSFRGDAAFRTWLLSIAWNRALSRRRSIGAWFSRRAPIEAADQVRGDGNGPLDAVREQELARHVAAAIERLSPKLRDALLLAQSGEYGYGEIAAMLQVPVGTLKSRVFDARQQVKQRLVALGYMSGE
ncbi:MAG TPA: sigma-70 family RNA polymerase sigma factor [Vicinamibacterales bacterium]|nr:sigma-70 family RNA polymerase sigma factor [Vicinamibacterales bacterium]